MILKKLLAFILASFIAIFLGIAALLINFFAGQWFLSYEEHLDGPYYLLAVDLMEDMSLDYDLGRGSFVGRISGNVFAVGWNKDYFVAKRHPHGFKTVTEFYYLIRDLDDPSDPSEVSICGPFNRIDFERKKEKLNLPDFSKEIPSLR